MSSVQKPLGSGYGMKLPTYIGIMSLSHEISGGFRNCHLQKKWPKQWSCHRPPLQIADRGLKGQGAMEIFKLLPHEMVPCATGGDGYGVVMMVMVVVTVRELDLLFF